MDENGDSLDEEFIAGSKIWHHFCDGDGCDHNWKVSTQSSSCPKCGKDSFSMVDNCFFDQLMMVHDKFTPKQFQELFR